MLRVLAASVTRTAPKSVLQQRPCVVQLVARSMRMFTSTRPRLNPEKVTVFRFQVERFLLMVKDKWDVGIES